MHCECSDVLCNSKKIKRIDNCSRLLHVALESKADSTGLFSQVLAAVLVFSLELSKVVDSHIVLSCTSGNFRINANTN
jgi:hypothetical protein